MLPQAWERTKKGLFPSGAHPETAHEIVDRRPHREDASGPSPGDLHIHLGPISVPCTACHDARHELQRHLTPRGFISGLLDLTDIEAVVPGFFPAPQVLVPVPATPVRDIGENAAVIGEEFQDLATLHARQDPGGAQDRDGTVGPESIQSAMGAMSGRGHVTLSLA